MGTRIDLDDVKVTLEARYGPLEKGSVITIVDLLETIDMLQNKVNELTTDIEMLKDNSKPLSVAEQVGISDKDFI